ncbi:MAG: hypothetical protein EA406_12130 [Rhodospirillales bacterium]|nr:MAG: hypothetical protein EA406_12130 [Rhodospirillales bacterium]
MDAAWPEYPGAAPRPTQAAGTPRPPNHTPEFRPFGADGLTFADVLDVVNPLQHIPVVSTIYRAVTGDSIAPASRLLGGALFGGVIGAIGAAINVIVDAISGRDLGEHVVAMVRGDHGDPVGLAASGRGTTVAALDPAFDMPFYDSSALDPKQSLPEVQGWARQLMAERLALAARHAVAVDRYVETAATAASASAGKRVDVTS